MPSIVEIFEKLSSTPGKNDKVAILKENEGDLLKKVCHYTYNGLKQYYVTTHTISERSEGENVCENENINWSNFLDILDMCDAHEISGHAAIEIINTFFTKVPELQEKWMKRVLDRHLNVGVTTKSINKAFQKNKKDPKLIPTFEVQLADKWPKFATKIQAKHELVAIEPKLDGFRCIAIIKNGKCNLFSRNGKEITKNFKNTVCADLEKSYNTKNIILDGELMGRSFKETAQQVHKKTNPQVQHIKFYVFDYLPYKDWITQEASITCQEAREVIEDMAFEIHTEFIRTVKRLVVPPTDIQEWHDIFIKQKPEGCEQFYEGIMIKTLDTKYKFGRGSNVLKYKSFFDVDIPCVAFEEGTGKYKGMLGAIIGKYKDVLVNAGSGFSDKQRVEIWNNRSSYRNKMFEVRYQEVTDDGSLRFPTFRSWRPDKD